MNKIVIFQLDGQQYGVDIQQVHSIERIPEITQIPKTPDFIKGIIHLRNDIIPLIDLKERLKMSLTEIRSQTRLLIVTIKGIQVGLLVDAATDVFDINDSAINSPTGLMANDQQTYIKGIAKLDNGLLILLDLDEILTFNEVNQVKEVVED